MLSKGGQKFKQRKEKKNEELLNQLWRSELNSISMCKNRGEATEDIEAQTKNKLQVDLNQRVNTKSAKTLFIGLYQKRYNRSNGNDILAGIYWIDS